MANEPPDAETLCGAWSTSSTRQVDAGCRRRSFSATRRCPRADRGRARAAARRIAPGAWMLARAPGVPRTRCSARATRSSRRRGCGRADGAARRDRAEAQHVAEKTVEEARELARRLRMRRGLLRQKLAAFEIVLERTAKTVQGGREKLRVHASRSGPSRARSVFDGPISPTGPPAHRRARASIRTQ